MVVPGFFGSVMLNTVKMFLPVVHVVLKGAVTVVAVVSLPHRADCELKPAGFHFFNHINETTMSSVTVNQEKLFTKT